MNNKRLIELLSQYPAYATVKILNEDGTISTVEGVEVVDQTLCIKAEEYV